MTYPLRVGEYIWGPVDLIGAPIGTTLTQSETARSRFTCVGPGQWTNPDHGTRRLTDRDVSGDGYYYIAELPEETVAEQGPETWGQFLWRFRDHVLAMSTRSGIHISPVQRALGTLGVGDERPLVPGMRVVNNTDLGRIAYGTQVSVGDRMDWSHYGLHVRDGRNGWTQLLGDYRGLPGGRRTIEAVPVPVEPWLDETVSDMASAISQFQVKAWLIGAKAKQENSWCGTYESVMKQLGITAQVLTNVTVDGLKVGDVITPSVARRLPPGSILVVNNGASREWFVRDTAAANQAGTRRLWGYGVNASDIAQYRRSMTIGYLAVNIPDTNEPLPMNIEVDQTMFDLLPPGTVMHYVHGGGNWTKATDGRLANGTTRTVPTRGGYTTNDFSGGIDGLRVKGLPL